MSIETEQYERNPFSVEAKQVTTENMEEVAEWCGGTIVPAANGSATYIDVKVNRPLTPRQSKAFAGDWVLFASGGFKVYPDKAFKKSFHKVTPAPKKHAVPKAFRDTPAGQFLEKAAGTPQKSVADEQAAFAASQS